MVSSRALAVVRQPDRHEHEAPRGTQRSGPFPLQQSWSGEQLFLHFLHSPVSSPAQPMQATAPQQIAPALPLQELSGLVLLGGGGGSALSPASSSSLLEDGTGGAASGTEGIAASFVFASL